MEVEDYLRKIEDLAYDPISDEVWEVIQCEHLEETQNMYKTAHWVQAILPITQEDRHGLIKLEEEAVDKFNYLDIKIKEIYGHRLIGLVDFDIGKIIIVKLL